MAVGKFLDPLEAVMAFLALVFVKWHGLPKKMSLVVGPWPYANVLFKFDSNRATSLLLILGTDAGGVNLRGRCGAGTQ